MKKLICFLLVLALLGSLWACTTAPVETPDSTENQPASSSEATQPSPEATDSPAEPVEIPMNEAGLPYFFDDYVDLSLERLNVARNELQYTVTELATGTVTELDSTERLLRGFTCGGTPVQDAAELFDDAAYVLRIAAPDSDWYMEFHDGEDADYVYLSEYGLYVPVLFRVNMTAERISEAVRRYAANGTLLEDTAYSGEFREGSPQANVTDAVNEAFASGGLEFTRVLPRIELSCDAFEAFNEEVLSRYSRETMVENFYNEVTYRWGVKGDVLSVLVICNSEQTDWDGAWAYNFSISEGRLLTAAEVYAAAGVENVQTRVLHAIVSFGAEEKRNSTVGVYFNDIDTTQNTLKCMVTELCDLNFMSAEPYFNEDGELCVVGYIRTGLGSGGAYACICVEDYVTDTLHSARDYYEQYDALAD